MNQKDRYQLPFDQYSRQLAVLEVINSLRAGNEKFRILDVGGHKGVTARLHQNDDVKVLDVYDGIDDQNYIKGDARNMEFDDDSFDFVVSFDVFEHIPREDRQKVVTECCRVAKRGVCIAAPVRLPSNEFAEQALNDFYKRLYNEDHQWLKEHIDYRLPEVGLAEGMLQKAGLKTALLGSNEIVAWAQMQGAIFLTSKYPEAISALKSLNVNYNKNLQLDAASDINQNYRHIAIGVNTSDDFKLVEKCIEGYTSGDRSMSGVKTAAYLNEFYADTFAEFARKLAKTRKEFDVVKQENQRLNQRLDRINRHFAVRFYKKLRNLISR